jgi:hypothetical protein
MKSELTWEEFLKAWAEQQVDFAEKYNISMKDIVWQMDGVKQFAGLYHQMVEDGLIPPEKQYKHNDGKAIDYMNEILSRFNEGEI